MMTNTHSPDSFNSTDSLLSGGRLEALRENAESKLKQAKKLEEKAKTYRSDAKAILASVEKIQSELDKLQSLNPAYLRPQSDGRMRTRAGSWTSEINEIVRAAMKGISYSEIKDRLSGGILADKLKESDKGFYGALQKLEKRGKLVRHKGHAFTVEAFEKYKRDVSDGKRDEVEPTAKRSSGLTPTVIRILTDANGKALTGRMIINELLRYPEVSEAIRRNHTGAYNVLTRLVRQGVVIKVEADKTYRLPLHNEEPQGTGVTSKETAPESGEATTSFNRGLL